jgi:hypothetical protein
MLEMLLAVEVSTRVTVMCCSLFVLRVAEVMAPYLFYVL